MIGKLSKIVLLCMVVSVGCKDDPLEDEIEKQKQADFLIQSNPGVYDGKQAVWEYDARLHQLSYGINSFRIQTDAQDRYLHYRLAVVPRVDEELEVSLTVSGIAGLKSGRYPVKVIQIQAGKIWLWCPEQAKGFLMLQE